MLAPDLFDMIKEHQGVFKNLALRNLRRGHNMNLPSGQAVKAAMEARGLALGPALTKARLTSGTTGRALRDAGLDNVTPLWFYVLKEAEEMEAGARLGTVGSYLVADTIIGLLKHDPSSYWSQSGSGADGRWHPRDGVSPIGTAVTSINALLEAAGLLESGIGSVPLALAAPTGGLAMALSAPAAARNRTEVARNVALVFHSVFSRHDPQYIENRPNDFVPFKGNREGWVSYFRTEVNIPLNAIYTDWNGIGADQRAKMHTQFFSQIFVDTVNSIMGRRRMTHHQRGMALVAALFSSVLAATGAGIQAQAASVAGVKLTDVCQAKDDVVDLDQFACKALGLEEECKGRSVLRQVASEEVFRLPVGQT